MSTLRGKKKGKTWNDKEKEQFLPVANVNKQDGESQIRSNNDGNFEKLTPKKKRSKSKDGNRTEREIAKKRPRRDEEEVTFRGNTERNETVRSRQNAAADISTNGGEVLQFRKGDNMIEMRIPAQQESEFLSEEESDEEIIVDRPPNDQCMNSGQINNNASYVQ